MAAILSSRPSYGQCTTAAATPIPDDGILTIQFNVSGLLDGNLASPTQGICGIMLDFTHEYLGDLTITLISPSGTQVQLVGPPTTAISPTNLSRWNIGFVGCGTAASPDAGFTDAWSNLQAWQALTPYSGMYHPQSGCLEDFNSGPANGIWQIVIEDHDPFQIGTLTSATLIFCNPTGLTCSECAPNAGTLTPASFTFCSGQNLQSSDITIDFGGNAPPPAQYGYQFLMTSGNSIIQSGFAFSITPPAGSYSICGLSYALTDQADIDNFIAVGDYDVLEQAINAGLVCAELTPNCIALNVMDKPDTVTVMTSLCNGEVFTYGGQNYTTDGIFYQVHDGPGLCDTVHEVRIASRPLSVMTLVPDTVSCGSGPVSLTASAMGAAGPFTFTWSTQNGNIVSAPNQATINVDQSGQYTVSVTDGVCEGTSGLTVHADQGFPQIIVHGGTITCNQPSFTINPIFIPTDGTVQWAGPGGFTSTSPSITVFQGGVYALTVANQAGCATTKAIDVLVDTMTRPVSVIALSKNCQAQTLELANSDESDVIGWYYTGPNGFMTDYWRPQVTNPGLYTFTATFVNGCTRSATYFFDGDFSIPDVSVPPNDTLNCNETIPLTVSSSVPNVTYSWTGPQGFSSRLASIVVAEPGHYVGRVSATNGCAATDTVQIALGPDVFTFQTLTDTLTCAKDSVFIGVVAPLADVFEWSNYSGPDSAEAVILVGLPGTYTVTMVDTQSGCEVVTSILVQGDFAAPYYGHARDTVTCTDPLAQLEFLPMPGQTYLYVEWQFPDLTTSTDYTVFTDMPGMYVLSVANKNGCIGQTAFELPFDTLGPFLLLETDTLSCMDTVQVSFQSPDSITSFTWSGPGIIGLNGMAADVNVPGGYLLHATGENGCITSETVFVDSNFVRPVFSMSADSLRCDQDAVISVITSEAGVRYEWTDPSGLLIGIDSFIQVNQPGLYQVLVTGTNRCLASDSVLIDPVLFPELILATDTFTCIQTDALLLASFSQPPVSFQWLDLAGTVISTMASINVPSSLPGPYVAVAIGQNACESRDTVLVPFDTIPPTAVILQTGEVRCQDRDFMLDGSGSTPGPLLYTWTTQGGIILSDPLMPSVQAMDTGIYQLTVEELNTGCRDTATLYVMDHPDAIVSAEVGITPAQCSGDGNAAIDILGIQGGIGPFLYQLGLAPPQTEPFFDGLAPGVFILHITDTEGCQFDTTITIMPTPTFTVDAGPDEEIYLGETASLEGMTSLPPDQLILESWDTITGQVCQACSSVEVSPFETTAYIYQVTTTTGCTRSDTVIVYVFEKGKFYIPNVFTPNGDGTNDEIRFFASPGIEKVVKWIIFDRWGNAVFGRENFDPGDPSVFWDGRTSAGDFPNSAVFAYILEIQLINGKIETWHGDITLIR